jgi:hypothetical protein
MTTLPDHWQAGFSPAARIVKLFCIVASSRDVAFGRLFDEALLRYTSLRGGKGMRGWRPRNYGGVCSHLIRWTRLERSSIKQTQTDTISLGESMHAT